MEAGKPSKTAWAAAAHRAAHQVLEQGRIFADPLAVRILGESEESVVRWAEERPSSRKMRYFIAARARFAEDALSAAVEGGVRQLVVLGAGLDTYAYRGRLADRLRIFEVDHPATQDWKRRRLEKAGIPVPATLTFASVDFERQTLADGLATAGFDDRKRTFFTWLGVMPYLSPEAALATLGMIASLPNGAHVVFDYSNPSDSFAPERRAEHEQRAAHVAALGEQWVSYFETDDLRAKLNALGFARIEDLGPRQIAERYFPRRATSLPDTGGHIVHAATV